MMRAFKGLLVAGAGAVVLFLAEARPGASKGQVSPCEDFYEFACSAWLQENPRPETQPWWTSIHLLLEKNTLLLRDALDEARRAKDAGPQTLRKLGAHYESCLASDREKSVATLSAMLQRVRRVRDVEGLIGVTADLHLKGVQALFSIAVIADPTDARRHAVRATVGGLGLPAVAMYSGPDRTLRDNYAAHVANMLALAGADRVRAAGTAAGIVAFETRLAALMPTAEERRESGAGVRMSVHDWQTSTGLAIAGYLRGTGLTNVTSAYVSTPRAFQALATLMRQSGISVLRAYLEWQVLRDAAPLLPERFSDESFRFYGAILQGTQARAEPWRRCLEAISRDFPSEVGRLFVERALRPEGAAHARALIDEIAEALADEIRGMAWMAPETRAHALEKLSRTARLVGGPKTWPPPPRVDVRADDFLGNSWQLQASQRRVRFARVDRPVDRTEWQQPVWFPDGYADASRNSIRISAGLLQPPFFDPGGDDAHNFGALGATVGHELIHLFDDGGRKYDANGNKRDWWAPEDAREFEHRSECLIRQYSEYQIDGGRVDGRLTLGENMSDLGGLRVAYEAFSRRPKPPSEPVSSFTREQQFFLGYAQAWCEHQTPQRLRQRLAGDPHSPGRFRVNGVLSNLPEFGRAFGCSSGDAMVRAETCRVW